MLVPAASCAVNSSDPADTPAPQAPGVLRFDMAAQPLHKALRRYSEMTGRSVLYDTRQVSGLQAPALHGLYTADEALRRLIVSSNLQAYFASHDVFMLRQSANSPAKPPGRASSQRWTAGVDAFYGEVQARITRVLCELPEVRQAGVRMLLVFGQDAAHALSGLRVHVPDLPRMAGRLRQRLDGLPLPAPPAQVAAQSVIMVVQPVGHDHWQRECS